MRPRLALVAADHHGELLVEPLRPGFGIPLEPLGRVVNDRFERCAARLVARLVHQDDVHASPQRIIKLLVEIFARLPVVMRDGVEVAEGVDAVQHVRSDARRGNFTAREPA